MVEKLLTEKDVCAHIGRAVATLQKDRVYGTGIPFVKIGRRAMYRESDVTAYLAALPAHRSTSEVSAKRGAGGRPRGSADDRLSSPIVAAWTRDDDRDPPSPVAAE